MTPLPVSLVIASLGRPMSLRRCLTAVAQLDYPAFEVVVVADAAGLTVARDFPAKTVGYDQANISAARNLGIAAAAGAVVAFIDDDAVPEPHWLRHLVAPFTDPTVAAAGGFVVGRNGISFQWKSGVVDRLLRCGPLQVPDDQPSLYPARPGRAVEIKGVNCAYRRSLLARLGGFDSELHYYLDETELNLRLAAVGAVTAIVPMARVHHAKAESATRRADHAPRSLFVIGASTAITLRRHGASADEIVARRPALQNEQHDRLTRMLVSGHIEPSEMARLTATFDAGFDAGMARQIGPLAPLCAPQSDFQKWPIRPFASAELMGRPWQKRRLCRQARDLRDQGARVRVLILGPTAWYHRIAFTDDGLWIQQGGLFGKSLRSDTCFRFWRFRARCEREFALWGASWRNS